MTSTFLTILLASILPFMQAAPTMDLPTTFNLDPRTVQEGQLTDIIITPFTTTNCAGIEDYAWTVHYGANHTYKDTLSYYLNRALSSSEVMTFYCGSAANTATGIETQEGCVTARCPISNFMVDNTDHSHLKPMDATPSDNCRSRYAFLYDHFDIHGTNFNEKLFGLGGQNLRGKIAKCGDLTAWQFKLTPDDHNYEWYAAGNLPISTKACVGQAVVAAGGVADGCVGGGL